MSRCLALSTYAFLLLALPFTANAACGALSNGVFAFPLTPASDAVVTVRALAATEGGLAAAEGAVAYDTSNDVLKTCDGSSWNSVGSGGGGGSTGVADRISSTNDAAMVRAFAGGTISITTGSVGGTSYFDSTGRWIGPGISITTANGISSTNGYFEGNVGIGRSSPASKLDVAGTIRATDLCDETGSNCKDISTGWSSTGLQLVSQSSAPYACTSGADGITVLTAVYTHCICRNGTGWVSSVNGATACTWAPIVATGGTITTSGAYKIHTFNSSGTFEITANSGTVEYLIVAGGGGGGGNYYAGGGGAGGVLLGSASLSIGTYSITVGAGGAGGTTTGVVGSNGSNSSFNSNVAVGGGGGGSYNGGVATTGGSGGGSSGYYATTVAGTSGQGSSGGGGGSHGGGGGGGAGGSGSNGTAANGGAGGPGIASSITGASVTYAGGGGGATYSGGVGGAGGSGGGGAGDNNSNGGVAGTANTGGGGGARSGYTNGVGAGKAGGSGVVIIRYVY